MRLLISVADADDAAAALVGGADLIDAKDPSAGPLGAVTVDTFARIVATVAGARPITAAIGDPVESDEAESIAEAFSRAGAALVKIGLGNIRDRRHVESLIAAAVRGATRGDPSHAAIATAYLDATTAADVSVPFVISAAIRSGARGVLIDTLDKCGPGIGARLSPGTLHDWVAQAHDADLLFSLAGRLTAADLPFVRAAGVDVAGVRGAACRGSRTGPIDVERVRELSAACRAGDQVAVTAAI